jgi:hypothetical protein
MNQVMEYLTSDILTGLVGVTIIAGLAAYALDTLILWMTTLFGDKE